MTINRRGFISLFGKTAVSVSAPLIVLPLQQQEIRAKVVEEKFKEIWNMDKIDKLIFNLMKEKDFRPLWEREIALNQDRYARFFTKIHYGSPDKAICVIMTGLELVQNCADIPGLCKAKIEKAIEDYKHQKHKFYYGQREDQL